MLSIFPRGVLDEILNLVESVSEDFPSYSFIDGNKVLNFLVEEGICTEDAECNPSGDIKILILFEKSIACC